MQDTIRNIVAVVLFLWLTISAGLALAQTGVADLPAHGNSLTGPLRTTDYPQGSCGQCHPGRADQMAFPKGLWRENDNELCFTCHREINFRGIWPGMEVYEPSNHRTDPRFLWPGLFPDPGREPGDEGKCLNCHSAHGRRDSLGLIPSLLVAREETLCLTCHDGDPSVKDIAREVGKPYSHPVRFVSGRHSADEDGNPERFSYIAGNRHAECSDCHNAHAAFGDPLPPTPPTASNRNVRVSRVRVLNGAAGAIPLYDFRSAFDSSSPVLEYEICFKCHSSWTEQPPGEQDMALLFNTNNASFHPVEERGKNPGIDPAAFAGGRNAFSTIFCSDCHGSEDADIRGPHGSSFPNLLRQSYEARSDSRPVTPDELCFLCHNFDIYGSPAGAFQQASRFNPPASPNGHAFHVGERNVPCYACHDSHGSPNFPALLVVGRNPGLLSFTAAANGGTCLATCHGPRTYATNYSR